ncbi:MAG: hypothetical protein IJ418_09135 [Clostridia bacterium]|nr:hypothetical protein [Clostridia bacterium]
MAYIKIDSGGRITAASKTHHCGDDEIDVTIPEEIGIESIHEYRYENGEFIHDPKPVEVIEPQPTTEERLAALEEENAQLKEALDLLLSGATEEVDADG